MIKKKKARLQPGLFAGPQPQTFVRKHEIHRDEAFSNGGYYTKNQRPG